jgi:hypothetical protein
MLGAAVNIGPYSTINVTSGLLYDLEDAFTCRFFDTHRLTHSLTYRIAELYNYRITELQNYRLTDSLAHSASHLPLDSGLFATSHRPSIFF